MTTDDIIASLGIPKRVLQGEPNTSGFYLDLLTKEQTRLDRLRQEFEKRVLEPTMEKVFPEVFWETAWICSPRGWVMKRREKPLQITWQ